MLAHPRFAIPSLAAALIAVPILLFGALFEWFLIEPGMIGEISFPLRITGIVLIVLIPYLGLAAIYYLLARVLFLVGHLSRLSLLAAALVFSLAIASGLALAPSTTPRDAAASFSVFLVLCLLISVPTVLVWWKVASNSTLKRDARKDDARLLP
jgi:hypothetical protein